MHPSPRASLRMLLILATTFTLLALPFPALAAKGAALEADVNALISAVSPGQRMAFSAAFVNDGSSTITHLTFDGVAPGATFVSGTAPCETGSGESVTCDVGTLPAGASVSMTFVFTAPASGTASFTGTFSGDANLGNAGAAKVDTWSETAWLTVDGSGDYFGTWQPSHGGATHSTTAIGGTNHQSTTVVVPAYGSDYPAILREVDDTSSCGIDGVGQAVELSAANGAVVAPYLTVTLRYDAVAAEGKSPGQIKMLHDCEPIPSDCRRSPTNCYTASWSGKGENRVLEVVVRLPHNGSIKGI